ncbi:PDC sensor domain-containing protein [Caminibacter profundus]
MNELVEIFEKNKTKIGNFVKDTILNSISIENPDIESLFKNFKSLELVYIVDNKTKKQISPNYYKNKIDKTQENKSREYLFEKVDKKTSLTTPYKSSATGNICITFAYSQNDKTIFLDFNLKKLLERLKLLETHTLFDNVTKLFYLLSSIAMILISFVILVYSGYEIIFMSEKSIMSFFKPIIYITIAIAIFDLSKTLIEQEVIFKSYKKDENIEKKTFIKFIISILIALSIEALMLVFKISLNNISLMSNAFWLFAGIALMIFTLTYFIKTNR